MEGAVWKDSLRLERNHLSGKKVYEAGSVDPVGRGGGRSQSGKEEKSESLLLI